MREPKDIIINNKTLEQILTEHKHWINENCDGWETMCANLRGANLSDANLCDANLYGADLYYANLEGADLRGAGLYDANLHGADLYGANLHGAYLCGANLYCANLYCVDLCYANLEGANLRGADLYGADLRDTNLRDTNLRGANLRDTKRKLIEYRRGKILSEDIIGYKKCRHGVIVTLLIPRGAIVFSINGEKCRTNRAKVIGIDGANRAYSKYNGMSYYVGDEFTVYNFNCEYNAECGEGIHFFMSKEEAENY